MPLPEPTLISSGISREPQGPKAIVPNRLESPTTVGTIFRLIVPTFADWCAVYLPTEKAGRWRLQVTHRDSAREEELRALADAYPLDPHDATTLVGRVLRTGRPELVADVPDIVLQAAAKDHHHLRALRTVGYRSALAVPLMANGEPVGALLLARCEGTRPFVRDELVLAGDFAALAALTVANARLFDGAEMAREAAVRFAERTAWLQSVTESLSETLTAEEVAEVVVSKGIPATGAWGGFLARTAPDADHLELVKAQGYEPALTQRWQRVPLSLATPLTDAIRERRIVFLGSLEERTRAYPHLRAVAEGNGEGSNVVIPLIHDGRVLGGLGFSFREKRTLTDEDRRFYMTLGRQCAQAIERARLFEAERRARAEAEAIAAALHERTEHLEVALAGGRLGSWVWEIGTGRIHWSTILQTLHGLVPGTFAGTYEAAVEVVHPDDRARVAAAVEAALASPEGRIDLEYRIRTHDGAVRWVSTRGEAFRDAHGVPQKMLGVTTDITQRKEFEQRLKLYHEIFAASLDAIAIVDAEGRYVEQNPAHQALLGYSDEELRGRTPDIHLGDEGFRSVLDGIGATGSYRGELASAGKDGRRLEIELSAFPLHDAEGQPEFLVGIKRDISERKRVEGMLREQFDQLQALYRLSDAAGRAEDMSAIYSAALDALQAALAADRASILLADADGIMRFKAARGLSEAYQRAADGHSPWALDTPDPQPITIVDAATEPGLDALRDVILGEGIRALAFIPLVHQGRLLGKFMVYRNEPHVFTKDEIQVAQTVASTIAFTVERARAQEALRNSEVWLRTIFDSLDEGILVISYPERRIANANKAIERIFGYNRGDILGRSTEFLHVDDKHFEEYGKRIAASFQKGEAAVFEFPARRKDGEVFVTEQHASLLRDPSGAVLGGLCVVRDISARKKAEEDLAAARRQVAQSEKLSALGTLVSGVAHEIRTPLTYVANNAHILRACLDQVPAESKPPVLAHAADQCDAIVEGVDRINRLVSELRRFTRLKPGERVTAPIHEVVPGALELFRAAQRGHVQVDLDLQPTPAIPLDKAQIQQVVLNLLDNAADAMPHGGRARVTTRLAEDRVEIVVEDDGQGIPPEVQARIFDEFFTTKREGTGLGLSIVRRIVEDHNGSITFETTLGKGTRFFVSFPLVHRPHVP